MNTSLRQFYEILPLSLKRLLCRLPYEVLTGRAYHETLRICRELDVMSRQDVLALQKRNLRALLEFAVQEVPLYKSLRPALAQLNPFDALRKFPCLTKGDVQRDYESLMPDGVHRIPHHESTTGGSSGEQLRFLEDDSSYAHEMGFMHAQWKRVGYTSRSKKATFRGVEFSRITATCFWQENPIHNELQFSPFHMYEDTLGLYVTKLIDYRPEFIHGYPSAVDVLAEYVIRHNLASELPKIKAALLGSEACSRMQRDRIEAAFGTRVYTWYGHSERTVLGGECECSPIYHAFPAYGILEIVRDDGTPCEVGEQGEIVGTTFLNRSMPLIRYRTDDYATKEAPWCECGRCWDRFSNVLGRRSLEGFVVGKNGSRFSAAALNMHGDLFRNVIRYQYYQGTAGQLVIRVIPAPGYSSLDEATIIAEHKKKLWGEMDVTVQRVDVIPLTSAGKQRRIVCDIKW